MVLRYAILLLVIVPAPSLATPPAKAVPDLSDYVHSVWQRTQGLPQDTVTTIVQARDGYVWLGTQEGLVRFDGARFSRFTKSTIPTITHNDVDKLVEGPDGSIWIGTFNGLIQLKAGVFIAHPSPQESAVRAISSLAVSREGTVWLGTQSNGMSRFDGTRYTTFGLAEGLPSLEIEDLTIDAEQRVWAATRGGLARFHDGRWTALAPDLPTPRQVVDAIQGGVWVGTDRGIFHVTGDTAHRLEQPDMLAHSPVSALYEDHAGRLWIGTNAGRIWRLAAGSWSTLELSPGTSGNVILAINEDRENNLWIGCYVTGLHRLRQGLFTNVTRQHGLADDSVRAIRQMRSGDVWLALEAAGVSRYAGGRVTNFSTAQGLPDNVVRALAEDAAGTVWVGTGAGVARFNGVRFEALPATRGYSIRSLAFDDEGVLWMGSSGQGVHRVLNGVPSKAAPYTGTPLTVGIVRMLYKDRAGTMWVSTNDALVAWRRGVPTTYASRDGLPPDTVYSFYEDSRGVYWIGSYGGGLARMEHGRVTRYRQVDGLFDDVVYQILEDDGHHLWMSCNNGVFRVSRADLDAFAEGRIARITSTAYDSSDGMLSGECNGNASPAGWRTADGRLWFPTTKGAVVIDPTDLGSGQQPPLVALERIVANRTPYSPLHDTVVPPGAGHVEFGYTALSFTAPWKVRYRYRLDGFDADWIDAGERRQTGYANLAPGPYTFRVIAANGDGPWSESGAAFHFVLRPRLHQTLAFRVVLLALGAWLIYGGYRFRLWRHVQRERELTARVDEALGSIKVLSGLIPICANCKRIRDDSGYWSQLEQYLRTHTDATFSHGICPDCMTRLYPDYSDPAP